ncbi:MAG: DNA internalization-related competence protein ComEC/Rec2 [Chloroflexi bacterium]|nr:DNA internalization-related competence protein ComEC/Rec2 [Chloroflexota bacterium]
MRQFAAAGGLIFGLALAQWSDYPLVGLTLVAGSGLVALFLRPGGPLLLASLFLLGFTFGAARVQIGEALAPADTLSLLVGQTVEVTGIVAEDPFLKGTRLRVRLDIESVAVEGETRPAHGGLIAWLRQPVALGQGVVEVGYGDRLRLAGRLEAPPVYPDFDYRGYLAQRGVRAAIFQPEVVGLDRSVGAAPLRWVYELRDGLDASLQRALAEPQAGLARALLLGRRDGLSPEVNDVFARAGIAHVLAISGLQVGVLLGIVLAASTALLGRQHGVHLLVALLFLWLYALLAGLSPSVQRAAVMGGAYLLALASGRQASGGLILLLAGAFLASVTPSILGEASFQLSFLAMAGLVYLAPLMASYFEKKAGPAGQTALGRSLIQGSAATLAATVFALPVVAYHFGAVSLVGLPATLLVLPALPVLLVVGGLSALAGLAAPGLGQALGWVSWLSLSYFLAVAQGFAALPFASFAFTQIGAFHLLIYYGILAFLLWWRVLGRPAGLLGPVVTPASGGVGYAGSAALIAIAVLGMLGVFLWWSALQPPGPYLQVSILDVGQGDAILVQAPSGRRLLLDGGPDPAVLDARLGAELPWWARRIDLLLLSHPQVDHLAGLLTVLERRPIGLVVETGLEGESAAYLRWRELMEEHGVGRAVGRAGSRVDLGGGAFLEVIYPEGPLLAATGADLNNNSLVVRLTYGDVSFLFPGDIEGDAERDMVARGLFLGATVLKVPHHGSATSSTSAFLQAVSPRAAIVSAGGGNRFGHPTDEVIGRLESAVGASRLYRTDRDGTVRFQTDGRRFWVETER